MADSKSNPMAGKGEVKAIRPPNKLKDKLGKGVNVKDLLTEERIQQSQALLDEASANFFEENAEDIKAIHQAATQLLANAGDEAALSEVRLRAHSIRGQSEALGYAMVARLLNSLHLFCKDHYRPVPEHALVVHKHAEALKVAFGEQMQGEGGILGEELVNSLRKLVLKFS
ncbi:MAG: hypothetical protein CMM94_04735 [Rickettsiales bacterium]|nr:hypothetical protein [Rickettsiales bacterium]|tara:strand:- start:588 stop:1100 length:513 start_codon:yes stop_codon:yes gene_type:complete